MRYQFIREHQHEFSVQRMCRVLDVTRSSYYVWQPEKTGPREQENQALVEQIRQEYKTSIWDLIRRVFAIRGYNAVINKSAQFSLDRYTKLYTIR